jgi:hypothetical protein
MSPYGAPHGQPGWQGMMGRFFRRVSIALGALLGLYLVVRAVAEFWVIDFSDPSSYALDWGGPSVVGVLAVHSGPGVAVVIGTAVWLLLRRRRVRGAADPSTVDR